MVIIGHNREHWLVNLLKNNLGTFIIKMSNVKREETVIFDLSQTDDSTTESMSSSGKNSVGYVLECYGTCQQTLRSRYSDILTTENIQLTEETEDSAENTKVCTSIILVKT